MIVFLERIFSSVFVQLPCIFRLSTAYSMVEMEKWDKNHVRSTRNHRNVFDGNEIRANYTMNPKQLEEFTNKSSKMVKNRDFSPKIHQTKSSLYFVLVKKEIDLEIWSTDDEQSRIQLAPFETKSHERISFGSMLVPHSKSRNVDALNGASKRRRSIIHENTNQMSMPSKKAKHSVVEQFKCITVDDFVEISDTDDENDTLKNEPTTSQIINDDIPTSNDETEDSFEDIPWVPIQMDCDVEDNSVKRRKSSNRRSVRSRSQIHTTIQSKLIENESTEKERTIFKCEHCEYTCITKQTFHKHLSTHPNGLFKCNLCLKIFTSRDQFNEHEEGHRKQCSKCYQRFDTKKMREQHENRCICRSYECFLCKRKKRSSEKLRAHMTIHTGDRPFPCKVCPRTFARKYDYNQHMKIHSR